MNEGYNGDQDQGLHDKDTLIRDITLRIDEIIDGTRDDSVLVRFELGQIVPPHMDHAPVPVEISGRDVDQDPQGLVKGAQDATKELRTRAVAHETALERKRLVGLDMKETDIEVALRFYRPTNPAAATYKAALPEDCTNDEVVHLESIELHADAGNVYARHQTVVVEDEHIKKVYEFTEIHGQPVATKLNIGLIFDELLGKVHAAFAGDKKSMERALEVLSGDKTDDEISGLLARISHTYRNAPLEWELTWLLPEIRQRAQAVRDAKPLQEKFGYEPSFAMLNDLRIYLQRLL